MKLEPPASLFFYAVFLMAVLTMGFGVAFMWSESNNEFYGKCFGSTALMALFFALILSAWKTALVNQDQIRFLIVWSNLSDVASL